MREIKLSLKDAQERSLCGQLDYERSCDDEQREEPVHKPGWHRAPTVADVIAAHKSRPVDPPRERDYAKLTEAAKRKEAPFVDWNGPSSDPCLKYAGIGGGGKPEAPAEEVRTSAAAPAPAPVADSAVGEWPKWCLKKMEVSDKEWLCRFDDADRAGSWYAPKECYPKEDPCTGSHLCGYKWGVKNFQLRQITESEALAWLESHGHAQVAAEMRGKVAGEFEPVGTIGREGDTVVWPWHVYDGWRREPHALKIARNGDHTFYDGYMDDVFSIADGDALALRILKRKNVAARAWKYPSNGLTCLLIGDHGYTRSGKIGKWADAGKRGPCQGGYRSEIHDPAEIQRLVAELHAAGLGK